MRGKIQNYIAYSFYAFLFFVPLVLFPKSSELFEFNKIILTYIFSVMIAALWIIRSIFKKKFIFKRTTLDLFLVIFLSSQLISTVISFDTRTSILGYYSRFNGGLLSFVAYSLLYWAFVSNLNKRHAINAIYIFLFSTLLVSIYAVLEHFGIDKDVWVQDVQTRVFSTMGQPNWLAAFVVTLMPVTWALGVNSKFKVKNEKLQFKIQNYWSYLVLSSLFFLTLIYTKSRSGFMGFGVSLVVFWSLFAFHFFRNKLKFKPILYKFIALHLSFIILATMSGTPWTSSITSLLSKKDAQNGTVSEEKYQGPALEVGGSASTEIRKIVWKGALDIWENYPIFGTGVETFAYSYYNFRPVEHNLVSEWDFLYNKAHNEYLNFMATTGSVGTIAYLILLLTMSIQILKIPFKSQDVKPSNSKRTGEGETETEGLTVIHIGLFAGFISILVTNFFGFSVVPVNLLLFLFPAFAITLSNVSEDAEKEKGRHITLNQKTAAGVTLLVAFSLWLMISRYWYADYLYAQGEAHADVGNYQTSQKLLNRAVTHSTKEAEYWQELADVNLSIALVLAENNDAKATRLVKDALIQSQKATQLSPKNVNVLRKRASMFIKLSVFDIEQLVSARQTLLQATELAPTEAKLFYNLGLVYARLGETDNAISTLEKTIEQKPNYEKAYLAYAILLDDVGETKKAIEQLEYILENINPNNETVKQTLEELLNSK